LINFFIGFYLFEQVEGHLRKPGSVVEYNQRRPGKYSKNFLDSLEIFASLLYATSEGRFPYPLFPFPLFPHLTHPLVPFSVLKGILGHFRVMIHAVNNADCKE
jgi:hypothetical protein